MNAAEARALLARAEVVCPADEVREAVGRLAGEINARLGEEYPLVLAIMGGATVFAGQLLPLLAFPLEFGAIAVTRYGNTTRGSEIDWRLAPGEDVRGRTVLVLDDILDEGITLAAVRARLAELGARRVLTAVLADKDLGRPKPVAPDFVGLRVPDRYVFGFAHPILQPRPPM